MNISSDCVPASSVDQAGDDDNGDEAAPENITKAIEPTRPEGEPAARVALRTRSDGTWTRSRGRRMQAQPTNGGHQDRRLEGKATIRA